MRRVITAFFVLFISICIGIQLSYDPGYVLLSINHWTVKPRSGLLYLL